jgi:hypothetical protein
LSISVSIENGIDYPRVVYWLKPAFSNLIAPIIGSLIGYYTTKKNRLTLGPLTCAFVGIALSAATSFNIPNGPEFARLLSSEYSFLVPKEIADAIQQGYIAYNWNNPLRTRGIMPLFLTMAGWGSGLISFLYKLKLSTETRHEYSQKVRKKIEKWDEEWRRKHAYEATPVREEK